MNLPKRYVNLRKHGEYDTMQVDVTPYCAGATQLALFTTFQAFADHGDVMTYEDCHGIKFTLTLIEEGKDVPEPEPEPLPLNGLYHGLIR